MWVTSKRRKIRSPYENPSQSVFFAGEKLNRFFTEREREFFYFVVSGGGYAME